MRIAYAFSNAWLSIKDMLPCFPVLRLQRFQLSFLSSVYKSLRVSQA